VTSCPHGDPFRHEVRAPRGAGFLFAATAALMLGACAINHHGEHEEDDFVSTEETPAAANGAIYQPGRDVALFENATARHVGDTVTVHLVEQTAAQKSSSTDTAKTSKATLPGPTVLGNPVTIHGTPILSGNLNNASSFAGSGDSKQSNSLSGDITVTVSKRLPNGNLLVRGQKWIGINQGKEFVRVQGVIRPIDILPDNSIVSSKVANARIAYGQNGALNDANSPGLLARFFNSPWLPF
jgi:flagellar L-ring protein precursor FlgH